MNSNLLNPARRRALGAGLGGAALALLGTRAQAAAWPARPLRVLLGYTPGGAADVTAREVLTPLGRLLGQPIVIDYKPGASGAIGAAEVMRAAPDGYTLGLLDNAPLTIVPALRRAGYDPLASFAPVAMVSQMPQVLVAPRSAGVATVQELLALMRRTPGKLSYASGGSGSVGHLVAELFKSRTGTFAVHVPYRGGAPAVTALLAGDVQFAFLTASATGPFIDSGKLKALGVSSLTRMPSLPHAPTIAESGVPGFDAPGWFALMGPAGLPEPVAATIRKALADVLAAPGVAGRLEALGQTVAPAGADVRRTIATEGATWKKLIDERKIAIEG
ncbi:tripartite-type tricarboxylate transporter receptor subunit TctC [Variovorax beijingensis]|uniref:Tripartite-type tricarboxylate transporter receptor subunit TctC n=2 Tax=Variovorax TaxID=34072 RepID=A0AAE4C1D8_VARPD|nr:MULTISPECIES: tripartite tricarboxylate transporter substrate binding protein [Variovorax]MDP9968678.1 tripartite-type tricarboxylate transporter receptor subunit TctC [Variovorax paradoxus]MDR6430202.1 tripartite-type tricarboxylate transporter receptor subunit TctC [Variovorax paradoxus]MDR6456837.1 tripartite-type tricarboxylate transporter receptor subunit TctC [Variovorax paradoxus]TWD73502.1 tripartite-type tricarboxylate transporter receptor subunit TctC [Variovorax beijingensis]